MSNYAEINPRLRYNRMIPVNDNPQDSYYLNKYDDGINDDENPDKYYCGGGSTLAIRGMLMNNTDVSRLFFSQENIRRIQRKLKSEIYRLTNGKFKMQVDQDEADLLINMRTVFFDNAKNLPDHIVTQVKALNQLTIQYIIPDMLTNIEQNYAYLKEISSPINPIPRPLSTGGKGRKALPSTTTIWGF